MADTKISALTAYPTPAGGDLIPVVDVSDTTMAASGTDKAATLTQLTGWLYAQTAATALPVSGTTPASLCNDSGAIGSRTLAANYLTAGKAFRISASGSFNPGGVASRFAFQLLLGGVVVADIANGGTPNTTQANTTVRGWVYEAVLTYIGSNLVVCEGLFGFFGASAFWVTSGVGLNGGTATVTAANSNTFDVQGAFTVAGTGQALAMNQLVITAIN